MRKKQSILILILFICAPAFADEEPVDLQVISQIKNEALRNSQVMNIIFYHCDVYGPRLTGTPNMTAAMEWSRDKLAEWGLANSEIEPWGEFGIGWTLEDFSIEMTEPTYMPIIAYPKAWIPGTDGLVSGTPVLVDIESDEDIEKYKGKLAGKIVLVGSPREAETHFEPDAVRKSDEELRELELAPEPRVGSPWMERMREFRARRELEYKLRMLFKEEGVAVLLEPSRGEHGTLFVGSGGSHRSNPDSALPAVTVAIEHYSRIARLLDKGIPVKLEIEIKTSFYDEDKTGYNVVAEIPGTDPGLKDQLVMLGGHLDSVHPGTGATDNSAGCAVTMEAVRIIKALDLKPRRTIRIALWSGEEQGFLGSSGYVARHFANRQTMELLPEHNKVSVYFNLDNGAGKIRGVYMQGNDAVRPIFEAWLKPFHDMGASTLTIRDTGGTDHLPFNWVGIPGFQFIQDPIDYRSRTHHTNMDVYDRVIESDLIQASIIMASFVYHAAMRDEMLPRLPLPEPRPMMRFNR